MQTTTTNTKEEVILTMDEISIKYFDYNLKTIKEIFENNILSESKKQEIANMVNEMAELFNNQELCIKNLNDDERLSNLFNCCKISQLSLIGQITKF